MTKPQLVRLEEPMIEKGIPVPPRNKWTNYPFPKMEVNDSVLMLPKDGESMLKFRERVTAAVVYTKRGTKKIFTTRKVDGGGIRVWRVE